MLFKWDKTADTALFKASSNQRNMIQLIEKYC